MSISIEEELRSYTFTQTDDPEVLARQDMIAQWALEASPKTREKVIAEGQLQGRLEEDRVMLRRVLGVRGLALAADDQTRINACNDLDTLRRWHDQAVVAASTAEALR